MKHAILIGDGMGDFPIESLGGKTPLERAKTVNLDRLAREGLLGRCQTVPEGMPPGSDVAIMSLMSYCAKGVLTGRGPLEAAALNVPLGEGDLAFRLNLVTLDLSNPDDPVMLNHASGDISNKEAGELVKALSERLPLPGNMSVRQGVSYRNILVWPGAPEGLASVPPHDWLDKSVKHILDDPAYKPLADLVRASWPVLGDHPVNLKRKVNKQPLANSIWLWGQGKTPLVPKYRERWGLTGATVSAVDIIRGLAIVTGLKPLTVPGATGTLDTNYKGKVDAALEALEENDLVIVHLEAPDECSHQGDLTAKLKAIENFDELIAGPMLEALPRFGDFRVLCACDHYTPVSLKTHVANPVPFAFYDSANPARSGAAGYGETEAEKSPVLIPDGPSLGELLFGKKPAA
ncbi:MAG: cofactor-independent phosphoglycerate mutase [Deltaproteobacteria bacterium]|jgi:2,3-bisphosphoglycerate-independent phosphoglycerate mutase|nr:cofactor-independent phosphoglycerate mutase [Deltaproteobacteria bacterium]